MFTAIALVVGLLQVVEVWSSDCVSQQSTHSSPINNCCNLGFRYSVFSENNKKPGVYCVKNFCGNCYSALANVYCDTVTDGGGWTVIQRRQDGSVEFELRYFSEYEEGFGNLTGEFWYRLRSLHRLTSKGRWELRVDLRLTYGTKYYFSYDQIRVDSAVNKYLCQDLKAIERLIIHFESTG